MKRICAYVCLSVGALAVPALAIDGTVVNQTTGKPQAGATVTLYKLGQAGMESMESVKSAADGKFTIQQDVAGGPRLIQTAFDGVTYNHMLPPGSPTTGLTLEVYNSSKKPGEATVAQHMVLMEPANGQMTVSETYIYKNDGKTTYLDLDRGTLQFYLPPAAKGIVQVNCTAPQGMPIQQAAEKTGKADTYKVAFPIKPGETRIDLTYLVPLAENGKFEGKILYKGGPTRLVTPNGVTLKGDAIQSLGAEPRSQANIYDVKGAAYSVEVAGTGALRQQQDAAADSGGDAQDNGPQIEQILPRVNSKAPVILALAFGILALGFATLYRARSPREAGAAAKDGNGRGRR